MRGSHYESGRKIPDEGIIPAHAGLTWALEQQFFSPRDHPRACGAHYFLFSKFRASKGSSPRMRGSPIAGARSCCAPGIIPAHAGLTSCCPIFIGKHGAHHKGAGGIAKVQGSSPRMRGSLEHTGVRLVVPGIIPAHAGLTSCIPRSMVRRRDHPRACGAHEESRLQSELAAGSSPRMRGSR